MYQNCPSMTRLKNYLFSSVNVDLRFLAAARILFSLLIICDLIIRSESIPDHYTATGLLPLEALFELYRKNSFDKL